METPASPPFKRIRTVDNVNECIREFKLYQQYPSMVLSPKSGNAATKLKPVSGVGQHCQKPTAKNIVLVLNKEGYGLCKLQKSRIISACGRDLGEIKLRPMSRSDVPKRSVASFSMQSAQKKIKTVVQDKAKWSQNLFPSSANGDGVPQKQTDKLSSNENWSQVKIIDACKRKNMPSSLTTLVTKRLLSENDDNQAKVKSSYHRESQPVQRKVNYIKVMNTKDAQQVPCSNKPIKKFVQIPTTPKLVVMKKNNSNCTNMYEKQSVNNARISEPEERYKKIICTDSASGRKSIVSLKSAQHKKVAESKFPLVKCEKLSLPLSKSKVVEQNVEDVRESKAVSHQNINRGNVHNEVAGVPISSTSFNNKHLTVENNTSNNLSPELTKHDPNDWCDNDTFRIKTGTSAFKSVNRVPQINSVASSNGTGSSKRSFSDAKINEKEVQNSTISNSIDSAENKVANKNDGRNFECARDLKNWSILQEAVNSVPDKELRAKALQALAACGTGSERQVPKPLLSDMKRVHDSTIQTEVFGLIDKDNFVLVQENVPDIQRINQIKRANLSVPTEDTSNTATCNLLSTEQLYPLNPQIDISNFEQLFEDLIDKTGDVIKINDIINHRNHDQRPRQVCNKIYTQLQKDFEMLKQFDEFGLLNIHKAVMWNRLQDVERHIMILQACKESVDILTQDGKTSLELAIECDVSVEIVNALLRAGAQSALIKPTHDSVLIAACKLSSPMLRELVNHISTSSPVKRRELLDQLDSTGFAALHYCAQKGNKEGVTILLQAGASVNLQDGRSGRTALFHAVENKHSDVMQVLCNYGAAPDIPNFMGQTIFALMDVLKNSPFKSSLSRIIK